MMQDTTPRSRRTVLGTIASLSGVALAGCLSDNGDSENPPDDGTSVPDDQNTLKRVAVEGTTLVVELTENADVDQINLVQPNGELFGKRQVATGVKQVTFDIGTAYAPGEYRVLALKGEKTAVDTTLQIRADLHIRAMGIGRKHPEKMWDGPTERVEDEAFVTIENTGTGPDAITKLLFLGDVPYPSSKEGTNYVENEDVSGIYDPKSDSEVSHVIVGASEQLTIYSSRSPFAFVPGAGTTCKNHSQTGQFRVALETRVGGDRVSKIYRIEYSASDEFDGCEITIEEESSNG